jgi:hypothetical protein
LLVTSAAVAAVLLPARYCALAVMIVGTAGRGSLRHGMLNLLAATKRTVVPAFASKWSFCCAESAESVKFTVHAAV